MRERMAKTAAVKRIVAACYPEYRGRKFRVSDEVPETLDSYWDGGSRDSYVFYQIGTGRAIAVHSNHPFFEADRTGGSNGKGETEILVLTGGGAIGSET
jgi:hypothetical protein